MKTAHVRPLGGRKLRLPERPQQIMPPEGMVVPLDDYWSARIAVGDAEIAPPRVAPKPQPRKAAPAAAKED